MKRLRRVAVTAVILLPWSLVAGADTVTNSMSAIVSYQFPDDLAHPASTDATLISAFVSYQRTEELSNAALTNGGLISSIASYQYFERLSDQYLRSQTSPPASYFFQYGTGGLQITVAGKVTDVDGTVIPGATIQASVGLRTIAVTTADTSGQYELSPLDVGLYVLTASAPAHASSARVLSAVVSTALQNFQLPVLPGPPPVTATTRPIPSDFAKPPSGPMNSSLKVFDANQFVSITAGNWVTADRAKQMTVVLTHGWIITEAGVELVKGVEGWPTDMARKYQNAKVTGVANIIAWDWHDAAASPLPPQERTPAQGLALGAALQAALGTGYEQPIHFLGHSLGTLVNACAANYLHGDRTAQQETAPTEWSPARTYLTLFDQAEVSRVASLQVLYDGLTLNLRDPTAVIRYVANTLSGWAPSMPINSAWADNYISLVGFYLPNTVNVALQKAEGFAGFEFWNAHGYPMQWYALSIDRPGDSILGFQRSREYLLANSEPVDSFPPPDSVLVLGDAYHQEPSATDQLALDLLPIQNLFQVIVPLFGNGADAIVSSTADAIQVVGDTLAETVSAADQAAEWVSQAFNYAASAASSGTEAVLGLFNSAALRLTLRTTPFQTRETDKILQLRSAAPGRSNNPAMAWVPLVIPANAAGMAFDFKVAGDPKSDVLVCGIAATNLFSLEAKFIPTNTVSGSRLLDVSSWAGTTNEVFFGLMGGTSTNCTLQVEKIRFYSIQRPKLNIAQQATGFVLGWPGSAVGYALETTPTLLNPTWESVTNPPSIWMGHYVLTNAWNNQARFFRLRQR